MCSLNIREYHSFNNFMKNRQGNDFWYNDKTILVSRSFLSMENQTEKREAVVEQKFDRNN